MVSKDIPFDFGWIKIRCSGRCPIVINKVFEPYSCVCVCQCSVSLFCLHMCVKHLLLKDNKERVITSQMSCWQALAACEPDQNRAASKHLALVKVPSSSLILSLLPSINIIILWNCYHHPPRQPEVSSTTSLPYGPHCPYVRGVARENRVAIFHRLLRCLG